MSHGDDPFFVTDSESDDEQPASSAPDPSDGMRVALRKYNNDPTLAPSPSPMVQDRSSSDRVPKAPPRPGDRDIMFVPAGMAKHQFSSVKDVLDGAEGKARSSIADQLSDRLVTGLVTGVSDVASSPSGRPGSSTLDTGTGGVLTFTAAASPLLSSRTDSGALSKGSLGRTAISQTSHPSSSSLSGGRRRGRIGADPTPSQSTSDSRRVLADSMDRSAEGTGRSTTTADGISSERHSREQSRHHSRHHHGGGDLSDSEDPHSHHHSRHGHRNRTSRGSRRKRQFSKHHGSEAVEDGFVDSDGDSGGSRSDGGRYYSHSDSETGGSHRRSRSRRKYHHSSSHYRRKSHRKRDRKSAAVDDSGDPSTLPRMEEEDSQRSEVGVSAGEDGIEHGVRRVDMSGESMKNGRSTKIKRVGSSGRKRKRKARSGSRSVSRSSPTKTGHPTHQSSESMSDIGSEFGEMPSRPGFAPLSPTTQRKAEQKIGTVAVMASETGVVMEPRCSLDPEAGRTVQDVVAGLKDRTMFSGSIGVTVTQESTVGTSTTDTTTTGTGRTSGTAGSSSLMSHHPGLMNPKGHSSAALSGHSLLSSSSSVIVTPVGSLIAEEEKAPSMLEWEERELSIGGGLMMSDPVSTTEVSYTHDPISDAVESVQKMKTDGSGSGPATAGAAVSSAEQKSSSSPPPFDSGDTPPPTTSLSTHRSTLEPVKPKLDDFRWTVSSDTDDSAGPPALPGQRMTFAPVTRSEHGETLTTTPQVSNNPPGMAKDGNGVGHQSIDQDGMLDVPIPVHAASVETDIFIGVESADAMNGVADSSSSTESAAGGGQSASSDIPNTPPVTSYKSPLATSAGDRGIMVADHTRSGSEGSWHFGSDEDDAGIGGADDEADFTTAPHHKALARHLTGPSVEQSSGAAASVGALTDRFSGDRLTKSSEASVGDRRRRTESGTVGFVSGTADGGSGVAAAAVSSSPTSSRNKGLMEKMKKRSKKRFRDGASGSSDSTSRVRSSRRNGGGSGTTAMVGGSGSTSIRKRRSRRGSRSRGDRRYGRSTGDRSPAESVSSFDSRSRSSSSSRSSGSSSSSDMDDRRHSKRRSRSRTRSRSRIPSRRKSRSHRSSRRRRRRKSDISLRLHDSDITATSSDGSSSSSGGTQISRHRRRRRDRRGHGTSTMSSSKHRRPSRSRSRRNRDRHLSGGKSVKHEKSMEKGKLLDDYSEENPTPQPLQRSGLGEEGGSLKSGGRSGSKAKTTTTDTTRREKLTRASSAASSQSIAIGEGTTATTTTTAGPPTSTSVGSGGASKTQQHSVQRDNGWDLVYLTSSPLVRKGLDGFQPLPQLDVSTERENLWRIIEEACNKKRVPMMPTHPASVASGRPPTLKIPRSHQFRVRHFNCTSSNLIHCVTIGCRILHYSGHGIPDSLVFEDPKDLGLSHNVHASLLSKILLDCDLNCKPELVFASACHSESVAKTFVHSGIKHVIAVKSEFEIKDDASIEFTKHFYDSLLNGHTIQRSFNHACNAVRGLASSSRYDDKRIILLPKDADHDVVLFPLVVESDYPMMKDIEPVLPAPGGSARSLIAAAAAASSEADLPQTSGFHFVHRSESADGFGTTVSGSKVTLKMEARKKIEVMKGKALMKKRKRKEKERKKRREAAKRRKQKKKEKREKKKRKKKEKKREKRKQRKRMESERRREMSASKASLYSSSTMMPEREDEDSLSDESLSDSDSSTDSSSPVSSSISDVSSVDTSDLDLDEDFFTKYRIDRMGSSERDLMAVSGTSPAGLSYPDFALASDTRGKHLITTPIDTTHEGSMLLTSFMSHAPSERPDIGGSSAAGGTRSMSPALHSGRSMGPGLPVMSQPMMMRTGFSMGGISYPTALTSVGPPGTVQFIDDTPPESFMAHMNAYLVPQATDKFTGRAIEMRELISHVMDNSVNIVNVYGEEGVGKSALTLMVSRYLYHRRVFEGGVFWIDCGKLLSDPAMMDPDASSTSLALSAHPSGVIAGSPAGSIVSLGSAAPEGSIETGTVAGITSSSVTGATAAASSSSSASSSRTIGILERAFRRTIGMDDYGIGGAGAGGGAGSSSMKGGGTGGSSLPMLMDSGSFVPSFAGGGTAPDYGVSRMGGASQILSQTNAGVMYIFNNVDPSEDITKDDMMKTLSEILKLFRRHTKLKILLTSRKKNDLNGVQMASSRGFSSYRMSSMMGARYYHLKRFKTLDTSSTFGGAMSVDLETANPAANLFVRLCDGKFRITDVMKHDGLMRRLDNLPGKILQYANTYHYYACDTLNQVIKCVDSTRSVGYFRSEMKSRYAARKKAERGRKKTPIKTPLGVGSAGTMVTSKSTPTLSQKSPPMASIPSTESMKTPLPGSSTVPTYTPMTATEGSSVTTAATVASSESGGVKLPSKQPTAKRVDSAASSSTVSSTGTSSSRAFSPTQSSTVGKQKLPKNTMMTSDEIIKKESSSDFIESGSTELSKKEMGGLVFTSDMPAHTKPPSPDSSSSDKVSMIPPAVSSSTSARKRARTKRAGGSSTSASASVSSSSAAAAASATTVTTGVVSTEHRKHRRREDRGSGSVSASVSASARSRHRTDRASISVEKKSSSSLDDRSQRKQAQQLRMRTIEKILRNGFARKIWILMTEQYIHRCERDSIPITMPLIEGSGGVPVCFNCSTIYPLVKDAFAKSAMVMRDLTFDLFIKACLSHGAAQDSSAKKSRSLISSSSSASPSSSTKTTTSLSLHIRKFDTFCEWFVGLCALIHRLPNLWNGNAEVNYIIDQYCFASSKEIEEVLNKDSRIPEGTFLLRFSLSKSRCLTLSYKLKPSKVVHLRALLFDVDDSSYPSASSSSSSSSAKGRSSPGSVFDGTSRSKSGDPSTSSSTTTTTTTTSGTMRKKPIGPARFVFGGSPTVLTLEEFVSRFRKIEYLFCERKTRSATRETSGTVCTCIPKSQISFATL